MYVNVLSHFMTNNVQPVVFTSSKRHIDAVKYFWLWDQEDLQFISQPLYRNVKGQVQSEET